MINKNEFENLYLDDADQKFLQSLSDKEREVILNERKKELKEIENKKMNIKTKNDVKFENIKFVVSKNMIIENLYKPTLKEINGCFIKVKLGNKYQVCKILNIIKGEPYNIELNLNKSLKTSIYFTIDSGNKIYDEFKIINISNKELLKDEFQEFLKEFEIKNIESLIKKYEIFEKNLKRSLNDNEILEMVNNKNNLNPRNISNTEKLMDLICRRDKAIELKDKINALKYQEMIISIEEEEKITSNKKEKDKLNDIKNYSYYI